MPYFANPDSWTARIKRTFDVAASAVALILLAPLLAAIALVIRVRLGSPVLFRQARPGLHGREFVILKFRTMTDTRGADGQLLPDAERLTSLGAFLRSSSLDELPGFWNVLRGDMSLVGPRPLLPDYMALYTPEQARRHEVRPGMTGLAQVSGRNAIGWNERFALDTWYVDNRSLLLDLRILLQTPLRVASRDGIRQQGHATVECFTGSTEQR